MWNREFLSDSSDSYEEEQLEEDIEEPYVKKEQRLKQSKINALSSTADSPTRKNHELKQTSSISLMRQKMNQVNMKSQRMPEESRNKRYSDISALLFTPKSKYSPYDSSNPRETEKQFFQFQPSALSVRTDMVPKPLNAEKVDLRAKTIDNKALPPITVPTNEKILTQNLEEKERTKTSKKTSVQDLRLEIEFKTNEKDEIAPDKIQKEDMKADLDNISIDKNKNFPYSLGRNSEPYKNVHKQSEEAIERHEEEQNPFTNLPIVQGNQKLSILTAPVAQSSMMQCTIHKGKSGFGGFYPKYFMHQSNDSQFVLAAKKRALNKSSNYLITMDPNDFSKKSRNYIAKLKSNFIGTCFHLFNNGLNPSHKRANSLNFREELMVIQYQMNILANKGPRKIRIVMPTLDDNNQRRIWKPAKKHDGILGNLKKQKLDGLMSYFNKMPEWNERTHTYTLDFNGRTDKDSIRNFQIIDQDQNIILQFGRCGNDKFNLDFTWPFTPVQAFACALSSIDDKFACE